MSTTQIMGQQFLASIDGFDGYFASVAGGEVESTVVKEYDGGSLQPIVMGSNPTTSNLTLTKLYNHTAHKTKLAELAKPGGVGAWTTSISIYDTDPQLGPIGEPDVYHNALLVKLTPPDRSAGSTDMQKFTLEFAVPGLA